jgi:rod shape determining protein RodA
MELRVERKTVTNVPWGLVGLVLLTSAVGVYNLASASRPPATPVWTSQLLYLAVGIVAVVVVAALDYRVIQSAAVPLYLLNIAMLLGLKVFGHTAKGAESWFVLGRFGCSRPSS